MMKHDFELADYVTLTRQACALGRLARACAHDFNNWLSIIHTATDLLDETAAHCAASADALAIITEAMDGAEQRNRALLAATCLDEPNRVPVDVHTLLDTAAHTLRAELGSNISIELVLEAQRSCVNAAPAALSEAVLELGRNSARAMPAGGSLRVSTAEKDFARAAAFDARAQAQLLAGPFIDIRIADDGCGMSPETLLRACEPFYTTRAAPPGTAGLGLPRVCAMVCAHGGAIALASQAGSGTELSILLPVLEL